MARSYIPKAKHTGLALIIVLLIYYLLHLPLFGVELAQFNFPGNSANDHWSSLLLYCGLLLITLVLNKIVSDKIEFSGKPTNYAKTSLLAFLLTYSMVLIGLFLLVFVFGWLQVTYKISHNPLNEYLNSTLRLFDTISFSLSASPKNLDSTFIFIVPLAVATFGFVVFERLIFLFGEKLIWFFALVIMFPIWINSYSHNTAAGEMTLYFLIAYSVYLMTTKVWLCVSAVFATQSSILLFSPDNIVYEGFKDIGNNCSINQQVSFFQFIDLPSNFFNPMEYHNELETMALVNWQSWWEVLALILFILNNAILLIGASKGKFIKPFWIREKIEIPKP